MERTQPVQDDRALLADGRQFLGVQANQVIHDENVALRLSYEERRRQHPQGPPRVVFLSASGNGLVIGDLLISAPPPLLFVYPGVLGS
ncbi:hypothetical protein ACFQ1S_39670, partial [Kibdelosporangium lantanae]